MDSEATTTLDGCEDGLDEGAVCGLATEDEDPTCDSPETCREHGCQRVECNRLRKAWEKLVTR